jgi:D-galactarolactone cycloisomerase
LHSADNKVSLMATVVAPAALGKDFHDPADAWQTLTGRTRRWAIQSGEHGPIAACIAGLDLALWDLAARRAGVSLSRLHCASPGRTTVSVYASGLNPDTVLEAVTLAKGTSGTIGEAVIKRMKRREWE